MLKRRHVDALHGGSAGRKGSRLASHGRTVEDRALARVPGEHALNLR